MPDQSDAPQSVAASAEQLPPAIRELHRAVLRGFRDSGQVHRDDLRPTAAALGLDLHDALHQLGSADLVHSAPDGQIEVAYPFSRQPTGHTVRLVGYPPVAAMCAIDALGIPMMTATAVVVIAQTECSGTLADTLCGSITFHTDQQHAHSHLDKHPELHGHIIGQADAISLADCAFRGLLAS